MKKLFLTNPRGFCAGVVRAINIVETALLKWGPPIYVKHEIVHNEHVVKSLQDKGVLFIEDLDIVPCGERVIYSAHGVSPEIRQQARKRGLQEVDATCGLVTKIHSAVKRFSKKGFQIILIGHRNHTEIIGIRGEAPENVIVVENIEDVETLPNFNEPVFCVTQTTLSLDDVKLISDALLKKYPTLQTLPTSSVCYATVNRQRALRAILDRVDLVLVIGDKKSSNSNRLCEVAIRRGIPAILIGDSSEISMDLIQNYSNIGLTAGASTPEYVVQSCITVLKDLGISEIEYITYVEEDVVFELPKELCLC
ncbi:MAG: 4-hydroxy-3-methylbut-2-enyl diphosphate reductase [Victivallaceae bacterium]